MTMAKRPTQWGQRYSPLSLLLLRKDRVALLSPRLPPPHRPSVSCECTHTDTDGFKLTDRLLNYCFCMTVRDSCICASPCSDPTEFKNVTQVVELLEEFVTKFKGLSKDLTAEL